ncbi:MAG TPA: hypothetical protein VMJ72_02150 [Candidatus Paceibacterota bacterium]|nr:hypothetical protein [Candidatus Paceibacterota bacterium]
MQIAYNVRFEARHKTEFSTDFERTVTVEDNHYTRHIVIHMMHSCGCWTCKERVQQLLNGLVRNLVPFNWNGEEIIVGFPLGKKYPELKEFIEEKFQCRVISMVRIIPA